MRKESSKSLGLASVFVCISTVCLMAISLLAKWGNDSVMNCLLSLLPLGLLMLPIEKDRKDFAAMFTKPVPAVCLFFIILLSRGSSPDAYDIGSCLLIFALGLSCLVFNSKDKGFAGLAVCTLYTILCSFVLSPEDYFKYLPFCISSTACVVLSVASLTGWFGKEYRVLYVMISLFLVWWNAYEIDTWNYEYLINLVFLPYYGSYDIAVVNDHLRNMRFIGGTTSPDISNVLTGKPHSARMFFILGAKYGWIIYVVIGIMLGLLVIGLIMLARKRKGLGRIFPLAALGTITFPLMLTFLDNLGIISAYTIRVPFISAGFVTNVLAVLLLRLSFTTSDEPESYLVPSQAQTVSDWLEFDHFVNLIESSSESKCDLPDDYGQICAFAISKDHNTEEICELFEEGEAAIPFKSDMKVAISGKPLLISRYYGGLGDILGIFSQLRIEHSEKHFVKVTVSESSNISRLLLGVERITNAMADRENVDYAVFLDSDLSKDRYRIQTLSVREANS